jgi:hypothetical protein
MLRFYLFIYHVLFSIIGHGRMLQRYLFKDRSFVILTSSIRQCFTYMLYCSQMVLNLLADSLIVAICHLDWLHGRKYGTVWYHPTSSMFYLIFFHPLSVSGKIDWHASGFKRPGLVWSQLCSACRVLGVRGQFYINSSRVVLACGWGATADSAARACWRRDGGWV